MGEFATLASVGAGTAATASATGVGDLGSFWTLSVPVRAAVLSASTLLLGILVVGLFPDYGTAAVDRVRESMLSSFIIGSVVAVVYGGCIGLIWFAAGQDPIVSLIAMPVLFVLVGLGTVWTAIGLVGLCQAAADLVGADHLAWGILGAVVVAGASVTAPAYGLAIAVLAAVFGFGAGIRTRPGVRSVPDRVVPPDRKV
ncbi:hypothetical protein [Haloarchaeobius litoreus]|uniref:DUF8173 domain-containing protein n=1 Tax=Haloarchaeobius litoreus TaxID=755306 RepID=A0ABD6DHJ8_9EURY|nr:hypothetical protein [Haloarchaeobius litoreus]